MKKKKRVKQYYIDSHGKLQFVKDMPMENFDSLQKENNSYEIDNISELESVEKTIAKYNEMAKTNPFLYNYDLKSDTSLHSIEEFVVLKGKKEIQFSKLVRTNIYRRNKRRRILKKNFKEWNKDVIKKLSDLKNYGSVQYANNRGIMISKVGVSSFIFIFVGFLFSICLLNTVFSIIGPVEGIFRDLLYYALLIIIFTLFASILVNKIISSSNRMFRKNKRHYKKELDKIENDFKNKYKFTYKYYLKNMPRNSSNFKKTQVVIDHTSIRLDRIKSVEEIVADGSKQLITRDKYSGSIKFFRIIIIILLSIASLYIYGLAIYQIALNLLEKM